MCVWVCAGRDPGVGYDERSLRWLLLDCDVCGHSSKSPAQVPAGIASHLYWRMGGGGQAGTVEDCSWEPPPHSLSEVGAGDSPSPISLSPFPSSATSSSASVFPGAGPRFSFTVNGVDTWVLRTPPQNPDPRKRQTFSSSVAPMGGLLWACSQGASSVCPSWGLRGLRAWKLMERGQAGSVLGQGAGSRKPEEPPAQVSPRWYPWQVGQDRCSSSGCALPGVSSQVRPNPQPPTGVPVFLGGMSGAGSLGPTGGECRDSRVPAGSLPAARTPDPLEASAQSPPALPYPGPCYQRELTSTPPGPPHPRLGAHKGRGGKRKIAEICLVSG